MDEWVFFRWLNPCKAAQFYDHLTTQSVSTSTGVSVSSLSSLRGCTSWRTARACWWSSLWQPTHSSSGTSPQKWLPQSCERWGWWWFRSRISHRARRLLLPLGYHGELLGLPGRLHCRPRSRGVAQGHTSQEVETTFKMPWNQKLWTNWNLKVLLIYHLRSSVSYLYLSIV